MGRRDQLGAAMSFEGRDRKVPAIDSPCGRRRWYDRGVTRPSLLALGVLATLAGCATSVDTDVRRDGRCLYEVGRPHMIGGEYQLYKAHRRVPADDLLVATADVSAARMEASKALLDEWLGVGSLVLGPVLFIPAWGFSATASRNRRPDRSQAASSSASPAPQASSRASFSTDARHASEGSAIDTYNQERAASCRP